MPIRPYLHAEIYDSNNPQLDERTFQKRNAKNNVVYDYRFREAFPTMWACAYELDKLVQAYAAAEDMSDLSAEHHAAVEEWMAMLVLYYSGVINPETIDKREFLDEENATSEYDSDLWPALSGTFPGRATDPLGSLTLLRVDDDERTVVGAYYPRLVFFPSRGRSAWRKSPVLTRYLSDGGDRLSWPRTYSATVREPVDRAELRELADYLASVGETLGGAYSTAIKKFCDSRRLILPSAARRFRDENPFANNAGWKRVIVEDAAAIMKAYPLVREVISNGVTQRTYFLVQDLRAPAPWMSENFGRGMPPPQFIRKRTDSEVTISWAGREIPYRLKRKERGDDVNEYVELIKDLFIDKPAYWCKPPAAGSGPEAFNAAIEGCHKQEVNSHENRSRELRQLCDDTALILAPVNAKFIQHFGYLDDQQNYGTDPPRLARKLRGASCTTVDVPVEGGVKEGASWTFLVTSQNGRELPITWSEVIEQSPKLTNKSVALWPPRVSSDWRLYAIRSIGEKKKESGSWVLVDEKGTYGTPESKSDFENLSILQDSTRENRPVALMLLDALDQPRGIFFLKLQANVSAPDDARLGVDFGTSNTCLAYAHQKSDIPQTLIFSLKPAWIWGRRPDDDTAGFVPYEWQGRSFYSTVLLAPKNNLALSNRSGTEITAADLFQVDIPVLHKGLAESLYDAGFERKWNAYPDLKWDVDDENRAWRAFFLSLSLVYAHAELLFNKGMKVSECVWTYPLAFSGQKAETFKGEADAVLRNVQKLCYGESRQCSSSKISESEAIALREGVETQGRNYVDVFIDIGGGSTDIAVYGGDRFLVQDSVEVAGRAFFAFAEESVDPSHPYTKYDTRGAQNFRENLSKLLHGTNNQFTKPNSQYADGQAFTADMYQLGTYYSIIIGNLPETAPDGRHSLMRGEMKIVEGGSINNRSYQTYRSRLFYRHIISYALLQACAAVLNDPALDPKFRLICSGNGWGLTLFAGLNRGGNTVTNAIKQEADYLLGVIKQSLLEKKQAGNGKKQDAAAEKMRERINELAVSKVKFLGRGEAKIAVAHGAVKNNKNKKRVPDPGGEVELDDDGQQGEEPERLVCYTGIKLDLIKVNGQRVTIDWLDQWSKERLLERVSERHNGINSIEFERLPEDGKPCDPLLSVFVAALDKWGEINSVIRMNGQYEENKELNKSPVNQLLARVLYPRGDRHYFLETMALAEKCE
jgi:hypothetical protein